MSRKVITKTSMKAEKELLEKEMRERAEAQARICPECGNEDESNYDSKGILFKKYKCSVCKCEWKIMMPFNEMLECMTEPYAVTEPEEAEDDK